MRSVFLATVISRMPVSRPTAAILSALLGIAGPGTVPPDMVDAVQPEYALSSKLVAIVLPSIIVAVD